MSRARQIEIRLQEGQWSKPSKQFTLKEILSKHIACKQAEGRSNGTIRKYRHDGRRIEEFAEIKKIKYISQLNLAFADEFRQWRIAQEIDPVTLHRQLVFLKQVTNFACSRDYLTSNPLAKLQNRRPKPNEQPCWTWDEVQRIVAAVPEAWRPAIALLAYTGMRAEELAYLTWDDVDQKRNLIHIRAKDDWKPKWGKERIVPILAWLKPILSSLPRTWRWVVTTPTTKRSPQVGHQLNLDQLREQLRPILQKFGLKGKLHTFRHSFVSHALSIGNPATTVRAWVGHDHQLITDLYTHVNEEVSQKAMRRMIEDAPIKTKDNGDSDRQSNSAQT
jgi:integrase/recombinase XerD